MPPPEPVLILLLHPLSSRLKFKSFHSISLQLLTTLLAAENAVSESESCRANVLLPVGMDLGMSGGRLSTWRALGPAAVTFRTSVANG